MNRTLITLVFVLFFISGDVLAQSGNTLPSPKSAKEKVIIDTDIGDDIDDAFAIGLALSSSELDILGFTTAWGNTELRARLLDRLLRETGHSEIPVAVGIQRYKEKGTTFSQAAWASREQEKSHPDAVTFLLDQIKKYPGEITLIAIGPETNLGTAIERDRATFAKLKRIILMAGSVRVGYDERAPILARPPVPEYNVVMDVPAAQAVFTSGVPLYVMPLDSTQLKLEERMRAMIFTRSTPLTDAMTLLYHLWSRETKQMTPTMFDTVAIAYAIDPQQCPVTPLHIKVDAEGYTREGPGKPNSYICLKSDSDTFFRFYLPRILAETQSASPQ